MVCPAALPRSGLAFYAGGLETLTFLFTDIEGSTALLGRLGEEVYARVLAGHHAIIRSGLAAHGGREVETQGDAFFAVFGSPAGCVAAVIQVQRALADRAWPGGEQVRVRMGVHTGEASATATGLVGLDVHRAALVAGGAGGVVRIHAIGGMAGVGKTAFAVHAAHRLADRFLAGQIFLPLHGHTPGHQPVDPADALASLLLTAGWPRRRSRPGGGGADGAVAGPAGRPAAAAAPG
jgi:class 3 adenylate cyclase